MCYGTTHSTPRQVRVCEDACWPAISAALLKAKGDDYPRPLWFGLVYQISWMVSNWEAEISSRIRALCPWRQRLGGSISVCLHFQRSHGRCSSRMAAASQKGRQALGRGRGANQRKTGRDDHNSCDLLDLECH